MRNSILILLGLYLDFIVVDAILGLATNVFGFSIGVSTDALATWAAEVLAALAVVVAMRLIGFSIGEWLLAYATAERNGGSMQRQWPNLVLGTMGALSGLKEMVRWTAPGDGMPFLFMVEETPTKVAALTIFGLLLGMGGVMLLRFNRGARIFNAILFAFSTVMIAINVIFYHDALVVAQMNRRANQGRPADFESAEAIVATVPLYGFSFMALIFLILYFCRERGRSA